MKERFGLIMVMNNEEKASDKICTYDKAFDTKEEAEKVAIREANKIRFLDDSFNKCHIYSTRTGVAIADNEEKPYKCMIHIVGFTCESGENKVFTIKDDLTEEEFDKFLNVLTSFEGNDIRKRVSCEVI